MANLPNPTASKRRRSRSRYGTQLQEKQDLKGIFGIREEQMKRYYKMARLGTGETGPNIVTILERRLDSAIFRAGFAQTRAQARQMATHRFFTVNGKPTDVPSYLLKTGDVVSVRESKKKSGHFSNFEKRMQATRTPSWITIIPKEFSFKVEALPTHQEANLGIDMRAVVEYFAR